MNWARRQLWLPWASLLLVLAGCRVLDTEQVPRDPMFVGHRPTEGKAPHAAPVALAVSEPTPPPVPAAILNRPSYAKNRPITETDHVVFTAPSEPIEPRIPQPRLTPGILTNRPLPPIE